MKETSLSVEMYAGFAWLEEKMKRFKRCLGEEDRSFAS